MSRIKILNKKYAQIGYISHNGELYLPLNYAIRFADECLENEIAIAGIDFIHKNNGKILPVVPVNSLDCSHLFSNFNNWEDIVKRSHYAAAVALKSEAQKDSKQLCTFTLLSKDEWLAHIR